MSTLKGQRYLRELAAPGLSRGARWKLVARWRRAGRLCTYCGLRPADTHDHAVPLRRGGTNYEGNLVPACRRCNTSKGNRTIMEWRLSHRRPR